MDQHTRRRREIGWRASPWLFALLLLVAISSLLPQTARGESSPIRADVLPLAIRSRSDAPASIDVKLQSRQQAILEGILELRVHAEGRHLFRLQTRELAIGPSGLTHRLLLPPGSPGQDVQVRFLTKKGDFELGRFPLDGGRTAGRQYLIAICGAASLSEGHPRLWQVLRPERIVSESLDPEEGVRSAPVFLAPEDLPSAIGLCAYDLLILEGKSFAALEEKQLTQITAWLEAGGNLCVAPSGPLDALHLAFLNQLAERAGQPAAVTAESDGKLSFRASPHILSRPGLGRMAILSSSPATDDELTAEPWRKVVSFLARAHAVGPEKKLSSRAPQPINSPVASASTLARATLSAMLPRPARMVPASFIITLLGVFVILVGPGEWIVLGRLRRRRWTWITFPMLSIVFAVIAVRAAEHYLGRGDRRASTIVTDLGAQGRVLRQNHLDFRFAGRDTTWVTEVRQGVSVLCAPEINGPKTESMIPTYQGSLTGQYTMQQALKQWSPQLQRTMYFGGEAELPKADWEQINARALSSRGLEPLRPWIDNLRSQGWTVQFMNGTQSKMLDQPSPQRAAYRDLVDALSQIRGAQRASWAATISPSGQDDLADMALFDPSTTREWLVVAIKSSGQTLHIVRRLYTYE